MSGIVLTFIITFAISLLLILVSQTSWGQARFGWMTSIVFYLLIGALLGMSLVGAAIIISGKIQPMLMGVG